MTFQYSLHVLRDPEAEEDVESSDLEHYEFIETGRIDPIPALIKSLRQNIQDTGSIIVWNKTFEAAQNKRMGEIYPQYAEFCQNMNEKMFDLMEIFGDLLYKHPKFKGSY